MRNYMTLKPPEMGKNVNAHTCRTSRRGPSRGSGTRLNAGPPARPELGVGPCNAGAYTSRYRAGFQVVVVPTVVGEGRLDRTRSIVSSVRVSRVMS